MANDEWLVQRQTSAESRIPCRPPPCSAETSADYNTIYDPTNGLPFNGNIIPSNRIDPISQKLLQYYHSAVLPGLTNNYVQDNAPPVSRDGFVLRMDFVESAKSQWTGRYSWGVDADTNQTIVQSGSKIFTGYEQYLGSNTRILSPNIVNEARFGYTRFYNALTTISGYTNDIVTTLGLPNLPGGLPVTWGIPGVGLTNYSGFGDNTDGPYENKNNTAQFIDNISWNHGKHSFKFGFEYDRQNFNQIGNQYPRGNYQFTANATIGYTARKGDLRHRRLLCRIPAGG